VSRIVEIHETVPHKGVVNLHHLTDLHCGAPDFAEDELKARISLIAKDPFARWTMGGDAGDLIRHNDRRYQIHELHPRYRMATDLRHATQEHLLELLEPIKDKCWAWIDGNHERKLDEINGGHFGVETCVKLGIERRFLGYDGDLLLQFKVGTRGGVLSQWVHIAHGWQSGRSRGAARNQAEKELGMSGADIFLRGHNHIPDDQTWMTRAIRKTSKGDQKPREVLTPRTWINGGSWRYGRRDLQEVNRDRLSEFEGSMWSETKGFRREPVGGAVLQLRFTQGYSARPRDDVKTNPIGVDHLRLNVVNEDTLGLAA
jgi:hypothetical protein